MMLKILQDKGALDATKANPLHFIIFCRWPLSAWLVEMFIHMLSLNYITIQSNMSTDARSSATNYFNSLDNQCQILITTFSCGMLSLNLHNSCANTIMMESARNLNEGFQAIGQLHHLSQAAPQKAFILYQEHSITRYLNYFNMKKALPQIAAVINDQIRVGMESARVGAQAQDQEENGGQC